MICKSYTKRDTLLDWRVNSATRKSESLVHWNSKSGDAHTSTLGRRMNSLAGMDGKFVPFIGDAPGDHSEHLRRGRSLAAGGGASGA